MEKNGTMKIEDVTMSRPPTFGQKLKAHLRKWWWVHLILFCAGFLIITLCLVYVGFPNIAQNDVNDSDLVIKSQRVSDATPDSVRLTIDTVSKSYSMFHPELDSFNASLSIPDSDAFGYITIPSSTAGDAVPIHVDQVMPIVNMSEWIRFNKQVLNQEFFEIQVHGDMQLHEGALPATTTDYNKVVKMKGMNGLKGFQIKNNKIKAGNKVSQLSADVFLPNPSVLTLEMGTVTLNLFVDGTQIGTSILDDVVLPPGGATFNMHGESDTQLVFKLLNKYPKLILPVDITGNKSVVNGVEIPYFGEVLASNTLHTDMNLKAALG